MGEFCLPGVTVTIIITIPRLAIAIRLGVTGRVDRFGLRSPQDRQDKLHINPYQLSLQDMPRPEIGIPGTCGRPSEKMILEALNQRDGRAIS